MESLEIIANQLGLTIERTPAEYGVPKGYCLFHLDSGEQAEMVGADGSTLKEMAELLASIMKYYYTQTKDYSEV